MKFAKKSIAVILAFLMVFSSFSMIMATAAGIYDWEVDTKFYRMKRNADGLIVDADGNVIGDADDNLTDGSTPVWIETTKAKKGESVKARVYIKTNFALGAFTFLHVYPTSALTADESAYEAVSGGYAALVNKDNPNVTNGAIGGYTKSGVGNTGKLNETVTEGYIDASAVENLSWTCVIMDTGSQTAAFTSDGSDWIYEMNFTVNDAETTELSQVYVLPESISDYDNFTAVSYVTAQTNDGAPWIKGGLQTPDDFDGLFNPPTLNDCDADSTLSTKSDVTFNAGSGTLSDGTATKTVTGYIKDAVTAPADPTPPAGMAFVGWVPSTVADPTSADVVDKTAITFDYDAVTYNALYESTDGSYTLNVYSMDVNGAYGDPVQSVIGASAGDTVYYDQSTIPAGFALDESQANVLSGTVTSDNSLALNVYLKRNTYKLTTNVDDVKTEVASYLYGAAVTAPESPTKTGYTFTGWSNLPSTMPAQDVEIIATWAAATDTAYTVNTYTMGVDGTYGDPVTETRYGTTGAEVDATPATVAEGFTLNAEKAAERTGTIAADGSLKLNVYIDRKTYTLTTNIDGNEATANYLYGAKVTVNDPTKTGYTFAGWQKDGTAEAVDFTDYTMPAENVKVNATWNVNKHTITFYKDTEKTIVIKSETVEYGKVPSYPADPVMPGKNFLGWKDSENSNGITSMPDRDVEVWAEYEDRHYNVTFVNEDGTSIEDGAWDRNDYLYNEEILAENVPDVPSKTGYTPIGWSIDGKTAATFPVTVTRNIEFKPLYEIKSFNAVFNPDGGEFDDGQTASKTVSVEYGAAINAPTAPTKAGYNFNGWLSQEGKEPSEYTGMPAKALQFTAQWTEATDTAYTVNTYTMGTDGQYVMTSENKTGTTGADVDVTPATVADGFTYNAAKSTATGTIAADGSLVLNVYIDRNSHNVTFKVNDAEYKTVSVLYGAAVTAPDYTVPEGHSFTGWTVPDTMPNEDITLNATLTANTYDAIFYLDEAKTNEYTRVPTVYGEEIQFPVDPEVAGMTFDGWDNDATVMGAGDMEFVAILTAIEYYIEFVNEDGTPYDDGSYDNIYYYNDSIDAPDVEPTKTGYDFDGWYVNDVKATFPVTIDTDITFEARFVPATDTPYTVETYTMGLDGNYGAADTQTLYGETDQPVTYDAPAVEGFTVDADNSVLSGTVAADGSLVLKVYYIRNQYTFKTVVDGTETPVTYYYGAAVATPEDPTKTGYSFDGWDAEIPATMPAKDVTVTAQFTINQYTITFDTDGGSEVAPITQDYGTDVTAPANPTKTGYTFLSWSEAVPATMPAENKTLTAQWQINQYTITFDTDGGSEVAPITDDYGAKITAPANPTKTGYTFNGWDTEIPATMPAGDMTIKAQWTEATDTKYTVETYTMKANGSYEKTSVDYTGKTNDPVDVTPATVAEGFTYNAAKSTATGTIVADGSLVLKVFIDRNSYKFTVNVDGSKTETTYRYGEDVVTPDDPEKTGYDFAGWYVGDNKVEVPATMPAGDMTITAQWTVKNYKLTYKSAGVTVAEYDVAYGTAKADMPVPADEPTWVGHTFTGWSALPETMPDRNITIAAQWTTNTYKLTYVSEGTTVAEYDVAYGTAQVDMPAPADDPVWVGHTFNGWSALPETMPAENVTITAEWDVDKYSVTFIADGKTVATGSFEYDSAISAPSYTAPTGYTFEGWTDTEGGSTALNDLGKVPVGGATFYAVLKANSYKLTFKVDGTVVNELDNVAYGSPIVTPEDPTPPEGKYFAGWVDETAGTVVPATMPAHDAVYVAKWIENDEAEYTIETYSMNTSGVYELTASVKSEDSVGKIKTAVSSTIPGFTFDADNSVMSGAIKADGSLVLKVYYARNIYTVTFDGGVPVNVYYGAKIPAEDPAPQTGKEFTGWTPEVPASMPAENLVFTSTWSDAEYTITYVVNGVETVETYTYGATVTAPADPVISGMTFKGWSKEIPATMPAENLIIVAQFDVAVFKVTFLDNDVNGAVLDEKLVRVGDEIPVTDKVPTKDYWAFKGWTDANGDPLPNAMPAQNIVAVPVFEKIPVKLIAREGSTTVIDRKDETSENYSNDSGYVYGLEEYLTEDALLNSFVDVQGDGRIEVIPVNVNFGPYRGTGTIIKVYDRMGSVDNTADDVLAETFTVVIFGDLNGDAVIKAVDSTIVDDEVYGFSSWSDETSDNYCEYMMVAADLDKNGVISSTDAANIDSTVAGVTIIDQVTGTIKR